MLVTYIEISKLLSQITFRIQIISHSFHVSVQSSHFLSQTECFSHIELYKNSNRENYFHNKGIWAKICLLHPWKKGYTVKCWFSCLKKKKKYILNLSNKLSSSRLLAAFVVIDFDKNPFKLKIIMFSWPITLWNSGVFPLGMFREVLVKISCCVKLFPVEHQSYM